MKTLLLSAYDAQSHAYWRKGLTDYFSDFDWQELVLPPRFFSWRVRGNPLSWVFGNTDINQQYDLLVATSMVDLATLRGLVPTLARVPSIVYFHENQFAYPASSSQIKSLEPQMVNLYSALAADRALFNSAYNRDSFLQGVSGLLRALPDHVPPGVVEAIASKSEVLPVPIAQSVYSVKRRPKPSGRALSVVWNHRWEYDKGPDRLLAALERLPDSLSFIFHIVGQSFRQHPAVFSEIRKLLSRRGWLGRWGYIENVEEYQRVLAEADIVLSTAIHDFQGLSIMEAVAAGCSPLVPDRLAYCELFGAQFRYVQSASSGEVEAEALAKVLEGYAEGNKLIPGAPDLSDFHWERLGPRYREIIDAVNNRL